MRADGILFDKDGTLFDFNATWVAWIEAAIARWSGGDDALGASIAAVLGFDRAAHRFDPASVVIAGTLREVAGALAPVRGRDPGALAGLIAEQSADVPVAEAVPLEPVLKGLRARGLKLGVATNDGEAPARAHLEAVGAAGLFDFVAGSDSGHGGKPAPGMCLACAEATGLSPERIVMVGDSTHDLVAGRAAGMQTVGVLTGLAGVQTLAPLADTVLPDIGHLPDWIGS
ncbi:MAG TPA: HAD family hydrolase [Rhodobacterales bacterium]|nr:HAD family hydrolase [Rhodobacterales bacterium]